MLVLSGFIASPVWVECKSCLFLLLVLPGLNVRPVCFYCLSCPGTMLCLIWTYLYTVCPVLVQCYGTYVLSGRLYCTDVLSWYNVWFCLDVCTVCSVLVHCYVLSARTVMYRMLPTSCPGTMLHMSCLYVM